MRLRPLMVVVPLIAALLAAGCGAAAGTATRAATPTATATPAAVESVTQARADAFAAVAARIYREEVAGPTGTRNAARIAHDPAVVAALRRGNHAALRAAALHELFL